MANVELVYPDSWLILFKGVELDNTYQHTFYFTSEASRDDFFLDNYTAFGAFDNMMYMRVKGENKIRIALDKMKAFDESIYQANYLRFKNKRYENKWFYAFITDINYINDMTCEVEYELDVMTTFFFDYHLGTCFVEREHAGADVISECLVPENLETGDYVFNSEAGYEPFLKHSSMHNNLSLVLVINDNFKKGSFLHPEDVDFEKYTGLPTSNRVESIPYATWTGDETDYYIVASDTTLQTFYDSKIGLLVGEGKTEALQGLFICPTCILDIASQGADAANLTYEMKKKFGDYEPFNNKLYTAPYKFCYIRDAAGNSNTYRFELSSDTNNDFSTAEIKFKYLGNISAVPSSMIAPLNYKGAGKRGNSQLAIDNLANFDEAMSFSSYPQLPLVTDAYKQWLAENGTLTILSGMKGALGGLTNAGSGVASAALGSALTVAGGAVGIAGGLVSTGLAVGTTLAKFQQAAIQPNQTLTAGTASILATQQITDYMIGTKEVTPAMAKSIDDYFTMYGYACHRCKVPSRHARTLWTYTKTLGCVINGNVPNRYLKHISQIFDNGITFWDTSQVGKVGDYTQNRGELHHRINEPIIHG